MSGSVRDNYGYPGLIVVVLRTDRTRVTASAKCTVIKEVNDDQDGCVNCLAGGTKAASRVHLRGSRGQGGLHTEGEDTLLRLTFCITRRRRS